MHSIDGLIAILKIVTQMIFTMNMEICFSHRLKWFFEIKNISFGP